MRIQRKVLFRIVFLLFLSSKACSLFVSLWVWQWASKDRKLRRWPACKLLRDYTYSPTGGDVPPSNTCSRADVFKVGALGGGCFRTRDARCVASISNRGPGWSEPGLSFSPADTTGVRYLQSRLGWKRRDQITLCFLYAPPPPLFYPKSQSATFALKLELEIKLFSFPKCQFKRVGQKKIE